MLNIPPLVGDGQGHYRIQVVGNSGSGKTTVGAKLSSILNLPHFSLDRYFWEPRWKETPADEFRAKIEKIMSENERGWIFDGEYRRHGGQIVFERATDIIWLDPPLLLYFPRVVIRTFLRLFKFQETCSPGCKESWREAFFSKKSILLYCLSSHKRKRAIWKEEMAVIGIGVGSSPPNQQRLRRFGGWGNELKHWLREVEEHLPKMITTVEG